MNAGTTVITTQTIGIVPAGSQGTVRDVQGTSIRVLITNLAPNCESTNILLPFMQPHFFTPGTCRPS